jgi:hypothetical protein
MKSEVEAFAVQLCVPSKIGTVRFFSTDFLLLHRAPWGRRKKSQ